MPGAVATAQLLSYANIVDVAMDQTNDVNLADTEDYGHRVQIEMPKAPLNNYFHWDRTSGAARPSAQLNAVNETAFRNALIEALGTTYVDIDGVAGGLHFGSASLSTNPDPRIRKDGAISANDLPLAYVMYKLYGNSVAPTLDKIYNMADTYGMVTNSTVATAIIASLKGNESGSLDLMFRDLISSDPHRFFTEDGVSEPAIFEVRPETSGHGTWKITEGDIIELKLKLQFQSKVSRRGVAGREINVSALGSYPDNQQIIINPGDYFYVRLQIKAVSGIPTADPSKILYQSGTNNTVVTGYNGNLTGELTIPDGVVRIAGSAFNGKSGLAKINFPDSMTTIDAYAFYNSGLISVNTNKVITVGVFAFSRCFSLTTATCPEVLVLQDTFDRCSALKTVSIPKVTTIGSWDDNYWHGTFAYCSSLVSITLPATLTNMYSNASRAQGPFIGCTALKSITLPAGVTNLPAYFCHGCTALTSVTLAPATVSIGASAFDGCTLLTSITIPATVTTIGGSAFRSARLTAITLPNVTSLGTYAFANNPALVSAIMPYVKDLNNTFLSCTALTTVEIPRLESMGSWSDAHHEGTFAGCTSLVTITLPNTLTNMYTNSSRSQGIFKGCTKLESIVIPNSVPSLPSDTFNGCVKLASVTLSSTLTTIGAAAFAGCILLTAITIPSSVTTIGDFAFVNSRITSISAPNVTSLGIRAFADNPALVSASVPKAVNIIGTFHRCSALSSVDISSVVTIAPRWDEDYGHGAFSYCAALTQINLPTTLRNINDANGRGQGAFIQCGLTSVDIPEGVATIGAVAFNGCASLASVTLPATLTAFNYSTYSGCAALTAIYFKGNAPTFTGTRPAGLTIYYKADKTGWGAVTGTKATW
jgi:hypothetical protein